jgi:hypothetical protein
MAGSAKVPPLGAVDPAVKLVFTKVKVAFLPAGTFAILTENVTLLEEVLAYFHTPIPEPE